MTEYKDQLLNHVDPPDEDEDESGGSDEDC